MMAMHVPAESFPPGEYIQDELDARGWTQIDFAEIIGRDPKTVNMIISGRTRITEDTAKLLEAALGLDAQYWLNLESAYRLSIARETAMTGLVSRKAQLYEKYPITPMVKRGWIERTESQEVLEHRIFSFFNVSRIDDVPVFAHAARKRNEPQKTPLQLAWLFRTNELAKALPISGFTQKKLQDALLSLKELLEYPEQIKHVPRILADAGIRFVVVEALPGSGIDGASYWIDKNSPVVAMSTLHDRIDNFWFVLLHELRHIANEHGLALDINLLEHKDAITKEEQIVNAEASDFLVPKQAMDDFIARVRPIFTTLSVTGFANRMSVHPGIVAGQLHHLGLVPYNAHTKALVKVRYIICSTALFDGWGTSMKLRSDQQ
jgi:HTH-type transcriptional regulator/antitoxin HigA